MSCNCRNSFAMFNPFKEEQKVERPKQKVIKKKKEPVEEKQEEIKEDEQVL